MSSRTSNLTFKKINPESQDKMRLKVANAIENFLKNRNEHKCKFVQPVKEIKEAKNFVKNNPDIVFTKADKANTTVAETRTNYNRKVKNLLQDENTPSPPRGHNI